MKSVVGFGGAVLALGVAVGACSANGDGSTSHQPGGDGTGGSGADAGAIFNDSGKGGGSIGQQCAGETRTGQAVPLDLFIMLDQSGSMGDSGKWTNITAALKAFFAAPPMTDLSVGLQYFGQPQGPCTQNTDCGIDNAQSTFTCNAGSCTECIVPFPGWPPTCLPPGLADSCQAADYAKAEVPIALLDANQAAALDASLGQHSPSTGTPTSAALDGALQFAKGWQAAHTDHKTVVVLATDGVPSGCDENVVNIAKIAGDAANASPPINTFIIGVGSELSNLDPVASAGGSNKTIVVDFSQQAFIDALNQAANQAASCVYTLPNGTDGGFDATKVNVQYTPPGATDPIQIGKVGGSGDCANGGWYYDDEFNPTKVLVCPSTCGDFKVSGTKVEFQVGCPTHVN